MKSFNLSDWALRHRSLVWYFMIVFMVAGVFSYLNLGREEDPALHHQDHGDPGAVAGRLGRGDDAPGHRPDREEARGAGISRLHEEHHRRRPDDGVRQSARHDQGARRQSDLGPRPQHDRRHQGRFSAGRRRSGLQRSLRRRVRQHLRVHRGRPDANGSCATAWRKSVPRVLQVPNVGTRRYRRRAGRGHLSGVLDPPGCGTRPRPAIDRGVAAGAECDRAVGRAPGRAGAHQRAGQRAVHLRGKPARRSICASTTASFR